MMSIKEREGGKQRNVTQSKAKKDTGRKSKYFTHIEPYLDAISAMMRSGSTMAILAERFKVAEGTLYEYQKRHPEFHEAIKENAEIADFAVENALYMNAKSGNLTAQIFWLKNRQSKRWRDKQHVFQASSTVVRKDYDNMTEDELEREMQQLDSIDIVDDHEIETDGGLH